MLGSSTGVRRAAIPEIVASCRENDAMSRKALLLYEEGDVTVLLSRHQRAQLLGQQVHVIDLRHGGQRPQRVTVAAHRASEEESERDASV